MKILKALLVRCTAIGISTILGAIMMEVILSFIASAAEAQLVFYPNLIFFSLIYAAACSLLIALLDLLGGRPWFNGLLAGVWMYALMVSHHTPSDLRDPAFFPGFVILSFLVSEIFCQAIASIYSAALRKSSQTLHLEAA